MAVSAAVAMRTVMGKVTVMHVPEREMLLRVVSCDFVEHEPLIRVQALLQLGRGIGQPGQLLRVLGRPIRVFARQGGGIDIGRDG